MKILIIYRRKEEDSWKAIHEIAEKLKEIGHEVDILSREEDLNIDSLSGSMGTLPALIEKRDGEKNYDIIYTQDWSIAFPLLIPNRILSQKHYCIFHNKESSGAKSRILQRIVGNIMGDKLIVTTEELKSAFQKSRLASSGIDKEIFKA